MQPTVRVVHRPMFWGVTAMVITTIVALVVAWVYISPPGQKLVAFYTDDAVSISSGDTVRIAGIIVGTVKDLSIEPNQVRVRASVDNQAFVGDQSQVQVRMLTVVGGYYVTIDSLGNAPLGDRPIPLERVTMPYSLIRTLSDSTKITDNVAARPINESISRVQQGFTGTNTDSVAQLIDAGNALTRTLERQRGQVSKILDLSNEFLAKLNANRDLFEFLVARIAILEQTLVLYGQGFATAIDGLGQIGTRLEALSRFYMPHRDDFLNRVQGVLGEFQAIADRNGLVVRLLRRVRERMEHTLSAQDNGTPPELFATDLCIPTEGSRC